MDLASQAYSIWQNAIRQDATLKKTVEELPGVVYSTKPHAPTDVGPEGVLAYVRTAQGTDALAWVDRDGKSVTESPLAILKAAECDPKTLGLDRFDNHHDLVRKGVELVQREGRRIGGQLRASDRRPSSAPTTGSRASWTRTPCSQPTQPHGLYRPSMPIR